MKASAEKEDISWNYAHPGWRSDPNDRKRIAAGREKRIDVNARVGCSPQPARRLHSTSREQSNDLSVNSWWPHESTGPLNEISARIELGQVDPNKHKREQQPQGVIAHCDGQAKTHSAHTRARTERIFRTWCSRLREFHFQWLEQDSN